MKYLTLLFLMLPSLVNAKCSGLEEFLIGNYPNRIFVENIGYDGEYAIFEPSLKEEKSIISVIGCIEGKYKKIQDFPFNVRSIDGLDYSDKDKRLYVSFIFETEQYGWIEKKNGTYVFELFYDPEL